MPSPHPLGMIQPRQATQRDFTRPTYGGHVAAVSALLGKPLIPWQRFVMDVACELDENGYLYYHKVILTAQRQVGKTQTDLARNVQNCLMGPDRRAWYTAQSGQHASAKWREMSETLVNAPRLKSLAERRLTNGSEVLTFRNGSEFRPHPPSEDSLHSKQSDTNSIDEAWAFSELKGDTLLGAIVPTTGTRRMLTKQQPQLWIESTEGTVESTFFNRELDAARASTDERTAFFDFGLMPDEDPTDLELVARRHPGYGYLFDMETLITASKNLPPGEFARAYGNRRTGATERVIPGGPWRDAAWLEAMPDGPVCFGAATGVDGIDTSIVAAQHLVTPNGPGIVVAMVKDGHAPGTWWALDRLKALAEKYPEAGFAIDRVGPSSALYDDAQRAGLRLIDLDSAKVTAACQKTLGGITNPNGPTLRHKPHEAFDSAAELATRRWISDGAWVFGRRASVGSISALEALNLASFGIDHLPTVMGFQLG